MYHSTPNIFSMAIYSSFRFLFLFVSYLYRSSNHSTKAININCYFVISNQNPHVIILKSNLTNPNAESWVIQVWRAFIYIRPLSWISWISIGVYVNAGSGLWLNQIWSYKKESTIVSKQCQKEIDKILNVIYKNNFQSWAIF
jgi:hypothetical protein